MKTKELQAKLDVKVKIRQFWRSMRAALSMPETAEILECLKSRIVAKAEDYVEKFDKCDATDSVTVGKLQEGRLICLEIVREFDVETSNKMVAKLDEEIKLLSDEIKKVSELETKGVGYEALMK
jgi:RNA binding exosome subunit